MSPRVRLLFIVDSITHRFQELTVLQDECIAMCYSAGRLTAVRYAAHRELPDQVAQVALEFEAGSWIVGVDPDDDSVLIDSRSGAVSKRLLVSDAPADSPWTEALGRAAQWIWILCNQQGYPDGIQFAFAEDGREVCRVQMIAVASTWQILPVPLR